MNAYVHGYSARETKRLKDQANTLVNLLHSGTKYPAGANVLEAGCGTGSQTVTLAAGSPLANFTCVDVSRDSLCKALEKMGELGLANIKFVEGDIFDLPFPDECFDHVFVCFVLEHLSEPLRALASLKRVLKKKAPSQ